MKTRWLITFQEHPDYRNIILRGACLAMAAIATNEGDVVINGGDEEYKKIAECSDMKHGDLMEGLNQAQKQQWLAPFVVNKDMQATTYLTTPEGEATNVRTQD